jgi:putative peptide zinc metalloprotease protein
MPPEQLELRGDLRVSRQETPAGISFVVKDPATGRFFRLREPEYFIAQQLDGATPVDIIRRRVEEKFGGPVARETVEQFIGTLQRTRLVQVRGAEVGHTPTGGGRVRGNCLRLRLKAFNPDHLFDRLVDKVGFCFTPHFLVFSALLILFAFGITLVNRDEIWQEVSRLYRFHVLLLAWLIIILVSAAHEFAHGLTCKHFGGQVHEIGFMLLYFHPALYCNVSDAWLFPEKGKRLWVTFAGPYFEIFLWAVAVVTWRVTEPGTWLSTVALVVVASSAVKLFFNLNPLIRLDGYYLLSDALGISNLRARAFGYLGRRLTALVGSPGRHVQEATARERRVYVAYGLLAGGYTAWFLGWVLSATGSFLTERYQGAGAILYAGLVGVMFQNPLQRWVARPALVRAGRARLAAVTRPVRVGLLLALLLATLFLVPWELTVSGEFSVAPRHNADVRAEVDGIIAEVYIDEGQAVAAGELIARLADRDYRAELRAVEAQIDETQARLKMLRAGPREEEVRVVLQTVQTAQTRHTHLYKRYEELERIHVTEEAKARADVAKGDERLRYARSDLERFKALFETGLIARMTFEEGEERAVVRERELEAAQAQLRTVLADDHAGIQKELAVAQKEVEEAQARLRLLKAGSRPEEIEGAEAVLARLLNQRDYLRDQLRLITVRSPVAGVVTTRKPREKVGQYVKKGDLIVDVHEFATIKAEIAVPEREIGDVKVGQPVVVKARAFPELPFEGLVTAIAPAAVKEEEGWRGKVFRVTTTIENPDLLLRPEMTGNAKIYCGARRIFDVLTRRLARYVRVEFWSWW